MREILVPGLSIGRVFWEHPCCGILRQPFSGSFFSRLIGKKKKKLLMLVLGVAFRTCVAIAGEDYCVIAADTRMSTGFSILTRNHSKIHQM